MLYAVPNRFLPEKPDPCLNAGMHYLDSAEALQRLRDAGRTLADISRLTGLPPVRVTERLRLCALEDGLRRYLREQHVPERIALTLLTLEEPIARRRMAVRIVGEKLCIRDAALLVASARRRCAALHPEKSQGQRVITLIRDVRPYHNALRDIAGQMNAAGLQATFMERREGRRMELTIAYSTRRRRTQRRQSM